MCPCMYTCKGHPQSSLLVHASYLKTIWFCLKIYDLLRLLQLWVGVWVGRWVCRYVDGLVGSCQITKNGINLDLIKITWFCLKIYNIWSVEALHLLEDVWIGGSCQFTKNGINLGGNQDISLLLEDLWSMGLLHQHTYPITYPPTYSSTYQVETAICNWN